VITETVKPTAGRASGSAKPAKQRAFGLIFEATAVNPSLALARRVPEAAKKPLKSLVSQ
jgi:hypothetical protein